MIRSFLFVPGDSERKLAKARESTADAIVIDLEDAVAADQKPAARRLALEHLRHRGGDGPQRFVRVNALTSGLLLDDLVAVMTGAPAGVMLPKCESQADLDVLGHYLSALETREGLPLGATQIVAIVTETARSVVTLAGRRLAHPRLLGLLWGAEDLAADVGAETNRDGQGAYLSVFDQVRHTCLMAAAAAGVVAIDAVYTDVADLEGLAAETASARRMGFRAKAAIHPAHIEVIHQAFAPTPEQVTWAQRVLEAFAQSDQTGVARLDGRMLDRPHRRQAERILEQARGVSDLSDRG